MDSSITDGSGTTVGADGAVAGLRPSLAPPVTSLKAELDVYPRFPREVLPALAAWWAVMLGLLFALDGYYLVVALIGTPTIAMLWPAGRTLGRSYLSYRTLPWITGIITMWIILAAGIVITETGWSFGVKSALFFSLPAIIGFGGVLVSLPWAQARPPVRMFFRPDLLFGDGRTLVGGTLMLVLGMRYLFAGHPPGVDWALPAWNWYSLAFGIGVGIIPIVLMRGMLKLVQRHMRLRDGIFTGYPSIAFREILLVLLALNFGFAFHYVFIGRVVFSTIGEPGAFPITGQFWLGVALIIGAAVWLVRVKGRIKRWIGEPFFFETFSQTLLKQLSFVIAWTALFYGFMSVLNGEVFGDFHGWDDQTYAGLGFALSGILVLTLGRAIAQSYQRKGMLAHWAGVLIPTQPDRARERIVVRLIKGLSRLNRDRQATVWKALYLTWDGIDPNERSLMIWAAQFVVTRFGPDEREMLASTQSKAISQLAPGARERALVDIQRAVAWLEHNGVASAGEFPSLAGQTASLEDAGSVPVKSGVITPG